MKQFLHSFYAPLLAGGILAISALSVSAATESPVWKWGNMLTGIAGQDNATAVLTSGSDRVYWLATDGSNEADTEITYAGSLLYCGSAAAGSSANKNLTFLATDAAGEKQWVVYTNSGDFASNEGGMAENSHGDIIICGTVRHSGEIPAEGPVFVDAEGNETSVDWTADRRFYRMFLTSVSKDGIINWVKTYDISTAPAQNASGNYADFTPNAINAYAIAIDGNDNIYVGGRYRNPMTFSTASGATVTLTPWNVSGWNGDSQASNGDAFLVKLDSEGNYLGHLEEGGEEVGMTAIQGLQVDNGSLYIYGYAKGCGTFTLGGVPLTANDYMCPIAGCLDTDLKPDWIKLYPGDAVGGKNALQNVGMTVSGSDLWLSGMYNGRISAAEGSEEYVESTQGNLREGFIIQLAAADGSWRAAADSRADFPQNYLTGYLKIFPGYGTDKNEIGVFGYAMNATVGVFLRTYDATTLRAVDTKCWDLVTQGGVPTAQAAACSADAIYLTARGNKAFQPLGGELSESISGYTNYLSCFALPQSAETGTVSIVPDEEEEAAYYTLQGIRVTNPAPGLYLYRKGAHWKKVAVK